MTDWDWSSVHVVTGEWWLFVIGLALLLIGLGLGYAWGRSRCPEIRFAEHWPEDPLTPGAGPP